MKDLKLITDEIKGLITITQDSQYNNVKADTVILSKNVKARLFGQVTEVVLNPGSLLYIHGSVTGKVANNGGTIHIFGD